LHNFSKGQQAAYDAVLRGENVFITGSGGNGKSYLTRALTDDHTVVCAPTGVAALNVEGTTCHKLFGLPIGLVEAKDWHIIPKSMSTLFKDDLIKRIIISEVGMVRADILTLIDKRLQKVKKNDKPFGGIQMIVEGDFFQLEPIVSASEYKDYYSTYTSNFCFVSSSWNFKVYELTEPQRHANPEQYAILNKLRVGKTKVIDEIMELAEDYDDVEDTIHLCSYKKDADSINSLWYAKIKAPETQYNAFIEGNFKSGDAPVGEVVKIKEGAKVLVCANDIWGEYVNGDRGVVKRVFPNSVLVELVDGREVQIQRFTWTAYEYVEEDGKLVKEVVGRYNQIPLLLGWAVSIHKAQGLTLDRAAIDIGKGCFAHGQLYVAISRVRDLTKLSFVSPISKSDVIVKKEVKEFYGVG
jgi:ATP-dependent DNA helicase PIF1